MTSKTISGTHSLRESAQSITDLVPAGRSLPDLEGVERPLIADGDPGTVILFWSAICSHCRRYDERLNAFEAEHPGVRLIVVASRQNEDRRSLATAVAERGLRFAVLLDGDRAVAKAFGVQQTPRAYLFDAQGRPAYRGAIDNFKYPRDEGFVAYLDEAIDDLRAGRDVRRRETPGFGCPIESVYYQA